MIELKCLNRKILEEFMSSGAFEQYDFLPITKHRAWSQIKNPKAVDEDVLLTLAFDQGQLAGYLGSLPDEIQTENGGVKFAWLSTLYVSEKFRGKRIAQQLLDEVFDKYEGKIAMTEFTPEAENLYNKTKKFDYITPKSGKRFYFRSDLAKLIPARKPALSFTFPFLKLFDFAVNTAVSARMVFAKTNRVNFETADFVDEESKAFLEKFRKNRTAEELNWIMKNPWVLTGNEPDKKYLFSSFSQEFQYFWVKIFNPQKELQTCALLQLRDDHLKIPYYFSNANAELFSQFMQGFIRDKKAKILTVYHPDLSDKFSEAKFFSLYRKNLERRYLFHKELLSVLPADFQPDFQDGDGDPVFT